MCTTCRARWGAPTSRCHRCALEVPPGVATCGACLVAPPAWDAADAALAYEAPWDRLVAAFKFDGALDLAPAFAELMAAARDPSRPPPSWLVPVPLGPARLRERGYNQAWELARRLARRLRVPADAHLLLRLRETPHQLALPRTERAANVRGAFAIEPQRAAEVRGREVTIVDDVMTTGATAAELARVLRAAGAARVDVWVLARTARPDAADEGRAH